MNPVHRPLASEFAAKPLSNPYTIADREKLENLLNQAHTLNDLILRAKEAGIDVQARLDAHQGMHAGAVRLHQMFFPPELPNLQE